MRNGKMYFVIVEKSMYWSHRRGRTHSALANISSDEAPIAAKRWATLVTSMQYLLLQATHLRPMPCLESFYPLLDSLRVGTSFGHGTLVPSRKHTGLQDAVVSMRLLACQVHVACAYV